MMEKWFEGSAPGRLDVMGGVADYSGSLVLQMPIREVTTAKLRLRNDYKCSIVSTVEGKRLEAFVDYRDILNNDNADLEFARDFFNRQDSISWAAYVLGCVLVLQREKRIEFRGGDFVIESAVPLGKGVSSSASIEVAIMKALQQAFAINFLGTELPRFAQMAENRVVGAACGLMDQLTSYFGQHDKLLPILCQPDTLKPTIALPEGIYFIGIDSGVRHSVGGSSYTDVRCAAFMGYTILANHLGTSVQELTNARTTNDRNTMPFNGYLSNVTVHQYENDFKKILPEIMKGDEFLKTYQTTIDPITQVKPDVYYSVRACASHPIFENARVNLFMSILSNWNKNRQEENARTLGDLMNQSHESYSACGLGSERTDELVEEFKKFSSVKGAKITGGGSGGTVCALALGNEGVNDVLRVHSHFSKKYRTALRLFR